MSVGLRSRIPEARRALLCEPWLDRKSGLVVVGLLSCPIARRVPPGAQADAVPDTWGPALGSGKLGKVINLCIPRGGPVPGGEL